MNGLDVFLKRNRDFAASQSAARELMPGALPNVGGELRNHWRRLTRREAFTSVDEFRFKGALLRCLWLCLYSG
jgi:hypothetical protein